MQEFVRQDTPGMLTAHAWNAHREVVRANQGTWNAPFVHLDSLQENLDRQNVIPTLRIDMPVMVSVVSSNPTGSNFIFLHLDATFVQKWQKCQICVTYENLECESKKWSHFLLFLKFSDFFRSPDCSNGWVGPSDWPMEDCPVKYYGFESGEGLVFYNNGTPSMDIPLVNDDLVSKHSLLGWLWWNSWLQSFKTVENDQCCPIVEIQTFFFA